MTQSTRSRFFVQEYVAKYLIHFDMANIAVIAELASRGALVSANLIMLILVLRRTLFLYFQSRKSQIRTPLLRTLLQDGMSLHSTRGSL